MIEIRLSDLTKTCDSCPAQWSGHAVDGRPVYIRYRWGGLSIEDESEVGGGTLLYTQCGDSLDGSMDESELRETVNALDEEVRIL